MGFADPPLAKKYDCQSKNMHGWTAGSSLSRWEGPAPIANNTGLLALQTHKNFNPAPDGGVVGSVFPLNSIIIR